MKQCSPLNNYYPFGMPEAGRSWSYQGEIIKYQSVYQDYTYGFNGMQRDNAKGTGSGYTTLFREYDPEIARWKSLDPKLKDFPSESPFSAMGNNPIMNTDVLGDDYFENQKTGAVYHNNIYSAKDVNKIEGSNWAHLGGNDMFMANVYDKDNSDAMLLLSYDKKHTPIKIISNNGKGPLLSNIRDGGTMTETWLNPKQAKQFMSDRGYDFKPLEAEVTEVSISQLVSDAQGPPINALPSDDRVKTIYNQIDTRTYVKRGSSTEFTVLKYFPSYRKFNGAGGLEDFVHQKRLYRYTAPRSISPDKFGLMLDFWNKVIFEYIDIKYIP